MNLTFEPFGDEPFGLFLVKTLLSFHYYQNAVAFCNPTLKTVYQTVFLTFRRTFFGIFLKICEVHIGTITCTSQSGTTTVTFLNKGKPNVEMIQEFLDVVNSGDAGYGNYGPKTTEAVTEWQKTLVTAGYLEMPEGVAYGYWGELTDEATRTFLRNNVAFSKVN